MIQFQHQDILIAATLNKTLGLTRQSNQKHKRGSLSNHHNYSYKQNWSWSSIEMTRNKSIYHDHYRLEIHSHTHWHNVTHTCLKFPSYVSHRVNCNFSSNRMYVKKFCSSSRHANVGETWVGMDGLAALEWYHDVTKHRRETTLE